MIMNIDYRDGQTGQGNAFRGLHPVEKERHWCFVHADFVDGGVALFSMAPGPQVVELIPQAPLYLRQGPKVSARANFADWLFWISKRGLFRLSRKTSAWLRSPPPDAELIPAEIIVRVWLPGPDPRVLGGDRHAIYPVAIDREAADFIHYGRDNAAPDGRRRYLVVKQGRGVQP
jgi:hypothetical protein